MTSKIIFVVKRVKNSKTQVKKGIFKFFPLKSDKISWFFCCIHDIYGRITGGKITSRYRIGRLVIYHEEKNGDFHHCNVYIGYRLHLTIYQRSFHVFSFDRDAQGYFL
ncbi:MAG: hypothetical protein Q6370_000610 [Candidatus Sigynarchaeota archaeon]